MLAGKKGLSGPKAFNHLLNASRVTTGLGSVGSLGTSLGISLGYQAAQMGLRHAAQVLKQ